MGAVLPPFAFPLTREQEQRRIAADHYVIGACERRAGPIVEHMSTANVARDLDVLRRRAGDDALHYAGYSYGSYLGATYAALYPGKVGAVVVDAVLDPVAWSTGEGREGRFLPFSTRLRSDQGAQATLEEFFRLCDEAGPRCAFANRAAERFAALADRLRDDPAEVVLPDGTTDTIGYADLIGLTLGALYDPEVWTLLADGLADVERPARGAGPRERPLRRAGPPAALPRPRRARRLPQRARGLPRRGVLGLRQPRRLRGVVAGRRRRRPAHPSSGAPGRGRPPSAPTGPGPTRTATWGRSTAPPPIRCSWSATASTPPRATRAP